ncbi:MAG: hypothetical protein RR768_03470, partial [Clostridium sp.]
SFQLLFGGISKNDHDSREYKVRKVQLLFLTVGAKDKNKGSRSNKWLVVATDRKPFFNSGSVIFKIE